MTADVDRTPAALADPTRRAAFSVRRGRLDEVSSAAGGGDLMSARRRHVG